MIEENVVAEAGTVHHLTLDTIKRLIREAGYVPRQRNVFYDYIDSAEVADERRPASQAGRVALPVLN